MTTRRTTSYLLCAILLAALSVLADSPDSLPSSSSGKVARVNSMEDGRPRGEVPPFDRNLILSGDGVWWGDKITVRHDGFSSIVQEDMMYLSARSIRASSLKKTKEGAPLEATFEIPTAVSGGVAGFGTVHRASAGCFLHLYPRGIKALKNIRGISYAPSTGHIWVAADSVIEEIDYWTLAPKVVRTIKGVAQPYISRVTEGDKLLYVDGVSGPIKVNQIDIGSGTVTPYAPISTKAFTRKIRPVGIAVAPNGSVCYLADASGGNKAGRVLRVSGEDNAPVMDGYGGLKNWGFPDPCGMDVGFSKQVYVGTLDKWVVTITDQEHSFSAFPTAEVAHSLQVDRDASTPEADNIFWSRSAGYTTASGADIVGTPEGFLSVEPLWAFSD